MKETWVQTPRDARFINVGVDFNGEVSFFKIIVIDDMNTLGMLVIDPDGNNISEITVENEDMVVNYFLFEERKFAIQLFATQYAYELIFSEQ